MRLTFDMSGRSVREPYSQLMTSVDVPTFSAWSLLSLTATAHGAPTYPDELDVLLRLGHDRPERSLCLAWRPRGDP